MVRTSRTSRIGLGLAIVCCYVAALPATSSAASWTAARLVPDAGFEESSSSAARWTTEGPAGAVSVVSSPVHGGQGAARLADTSATDGVSLRGEHLAASPGEELTASAWTDRVSGQGGYLYLEFWNAAGARVAAFSTAAGTSTGWQQVTVRGVVPDDAVTATVLAYSDVADQGTTVWDDVAVATLPPPSRRVPNAGFEEPREGTRPTEWTVSAPGGSATVVTSGAHSGKRALKIADTSSSDEVSALSRAVPVTAGETVTASAWVSGTNGTLYLEYRRSDGTRIEPPTAVNVGTAGGWKKVTAAAVVPSGATTTTVRLYSTQTGTGTTTWDDVVLRSSQDPGYAEAVGTGPVLFVGDQRVESSTGLTRTVHPGTKTGDPALASVGAGVVLDGGSWDKNPRLSGTVLPAPGGGYRMWYTAADTDCGYCTGYAESTDGVHWDRSAETHSVYSYAPGGVVADPAPTGPRYYMLHSHGPGSPQSNHYYAAQSTDGKTWTELNSGNPVINGWDVVNVTYDPDTSRFVAMTKQYPVDYAANTRPAGPRTVWMSTSTDFVHWTSPKPSFAADLRDDAAITDPAPSGHARWSEVYGMPAIRYGEQYLGLPWVFDITDSPTTLADPGPDKGRQHVGLASSQDLLTWSRPSLGDVVAPGAAGTWDWGWDMTGTTLLTVGDQVRLYYAAFAGQHSCSDTDVTAGLCTKPFGNSRVGLVTWPKDRFESFHAGTGGGSVTTRTLSPAGTGLTVNVAPGSGSLKVEVLDAGGNPVPGYTADDATPVTSDTLGTAVRWGTRTTLPAGPLRLRFDLTAGDLYSYTIS
ncbi:carbohydrate binding domain-containing protein [Actinomadura sp. DC4]|uniref:carbohydrate binding domain-containing protein n=1 Tax=Actinomadura sp. DC4 TaxID=3055069 RepID=UPI0025AFC918|nr:carbohydrate binding domain-containing protein [Actinomadura sp. DC4]MDN3357507.1 carbohydrate binding domain-containing protein [Actinomadura sp. DC4]